MRRLWLAWMPLLYLPNFGLGGRTAFGTLELSDFLIGPFLVLLALAPRMRPEATSPVVRSSMMPLAAFSAWALLSTLLIRERYGYADHGAVLVGLLKLGKLVLYGAAGVAVSRRIVDDDDRRGFAWSLLASGLVVAVGLILAQDHDDAFRPDQAPAGYKAANAVSAMMAALLCYQGGALLVGEGSRRWRLVAAPSLVVMAAGFFLSRGRGGWVAAFAGALYLLARTGIGARFVVGVAAVGVVTVGAYATLPDFREDVDRTLWPDRDAMAWYASGVAGVDDGARLSTWAHELNALAKSPLLGTGFYHRGGASGLWSTGSHNFFLQMALETGLVGGLLVLEWFRRAWRVAADNVPARAALVAAFASGLSGEYYYGGLVLFNLMAVMAAVFSLGAPAASAAREPSAPLMRQGLLT